MDAINKMKISLEVKGLDIDVSEFKNKNYIGTNIRFLRKKYDLSQKDLSDVLGYKSYTSLNKIEAGHHDPPISVLIELSKLFKMSIDSIILIDLSQEDTFNQNKGSIRRNEIIGTIEQLLNELKLLRR